jgi:hypothetical protein
MQQNLGSRFRSIATAAGMLLSTLSMPSLKAGIFQEYAADIKAGTKTENVDKGAGSHKADVDRYLKTLGVVEAGQVTQDFYYSRQAALFYERDWYAYRGKEICCKGDNLSDLEQRLVLKLPDGLRIVETPTIQNLKIGQEVNFKIDFDSNCNFQNLYSATSELVRELLKQFKHYDDHRYEDFIKLINSNVFQSLDPDLQEHSLSAISGACQSLGESDVQYAWMLSAFCRLIVEKPAIISARQPDGTSVAEQLNEIFSLSKQYPIAAGKFILSILDSLEGRCESFDQKFRGTCVASSMIVTLAEARPEIYLKLVCNLLLKKQPVLNLDPADSAIDQLPKALVNDPHMNQVNWMLVNVLMDAFNGPIQKYDPINDSHHSDNLLMGNGARMSELCDVLNQLSSGRVFNTVTVSDLSLQHFQVIERDKDMAVFSVQWRKLSEQEIERSLKKHGGNRADVVDSEGYGRHAIAFKGIQDGRLVFYSTYGRAGDSAYPAAAQVDYIWGTFSITPEDFNKMDPSGVISTRSIEGILQISGSAVKSQEQAQSDLEKQKLFLLGLSSTLLLVAWSTLSIYHRRLQLDGKIWNIDQ